MRHSKHTLFGCSRSWPAGHTHEWSIPVTWDSVMSITTSLRRCKKTNDAGHGHEVMQCADGNEGARFRVTGVADEENDDLVYCIQIYSSIRLSVRAEVAHSPR